MVKEETACALGLLDDAGFHAGGSLDRRSRGSDPTATVGWPSATKRPTRGDGAQPSASTSSAITSASASDEVAAGEGALRTWTACSVSETTKSSTSDPSRPIACARTPAGGRARRRRGAAPARSGGTRRRTSGCSARGRSRSGRCARSWRIIRQVPGQPSVSARSRGSTRLQPVCVAGADEQRRRAEQHLAVVSAGQVHAEEGQVGIRHGIDVAIARGAGGRRAGVGTRPGTGRSAGRCRRRRAPPSRSAQAPAQRTALPASTWPCDVWIASRPPIASNERTSQPMISRPPACSSSAASDAATTVKSTTPVAGECRAETPAACGSISRSSSGPTRREPRHPVRGSRGARARRVAAARLARSRRSPCRRGWAAIPRSSQYA